MFIGVMKRKGFVGVMYLGFCLMLCRDLDFQFSISLRLSGPELLFSVIHQIFPHSVTFETRDYAESSLYAHGIQNSGKRGRKILKLFLSL